LQIKNALARSSDGVSGEMVTGVYVNFKAWHVSEYTILGPLPAFPKYELQTLNNYLKFFFSYLGEVPRLAAEGGAGYNANISSKEQPCTIKRY
jgi:hypothetical protein